ncbi:MAG: phosphoglycerate mutase [Oligoflexales bacterium]|nr:phosphoglycerate mutase [Oligoflexales bacterium]
MKKAMLVVIDGLHDEGIEILGGRSSFEYAFHPNIDALARGGERGFLAPSSNETSPESMSSILSLLGVRRDHFPSGRAAFELVSHGYGLKDDEVVMRCNLVAEDSMGRLKSFNGGGLSKCRLKRTGEILSGSRGIRFIHLSGYRNLIVMNRRLLNGCSRFPAPPHESVGENLDGLLSGIFSSSPGLRDFAEMASRAISVFGDEDTRYRLYPWGMSERAEVPSFENMYGKRGAAVCAAEIARGIALSLGMSVPGLDGITSDTDTDLSAKARAALSLLSDHDFVLVHINGTDEVSHRRDVMGKVKFIEKIDDEFAGALVDGPLGGVNIMFCSDHATSPISGRHLGIPVPYVICRAMENGGAEALETSVNRIAVPEYLMRI